MPRLSICTLLLAVLLPAGLSAQAEGFDPDDVTREVFALLEESRAEAGVGAFARMAMLDGVATERARYVASLPHSRRLSIDEPISAKVQEAGLLTYRNLALHLDMQRGYQFPASAFFVNWKKYASWKTVLDERYDGIGLGVARGEDEWIVLVAVLLDELELPTDLRGLERETIGTVNAEREKKGLAPLAYDPNLGQVARAHSEDMARREYFAHKSPEGDAVGARARQAGLTFKMLAENIYRGHDIPNPALAATEAWMGSRGHRRNILDDRVSLTGMGIAIDDRGNIYFTQVFANP